LHVEFFERDPPPSNKRYASAHRPLYFEGPLSPGQAIKWSVEGRGTEFEVQNPVPGAIGSAGDDAAPTNLLAELLHANNRPVRLHGAMMLAYLGDPRAREATLELREALREAESPYLSRVLQALAPVKVCNLVVRPASDGRRRVEACMYNDSDEPRRDLGLELRGLDGHVSYRDPVGVPPTVLGETLWRLPTELPPRSGTRVRQELAADAFESTPAALEAVADRVDLLR
jgi:hypothetical protein